MSRSRFDSTSSRYRKPYLKFFVVVRFVLARFVVLGFVLALSSLSTLAAETKASNPPLPLGSWENWIQETLAGSDSPRPDGLARMAPLPVWVDCHLSWWVDRPRKATAPLKIPSEIILRASPRICQGQLEQWAQ